MSKPCIVKGCESNNNKGLFPFPARGTEKNSAWITSLRKHQEIPETYADYMICLLHFAEFDFVDCNKESMQLREHAVPRIFPECNGESSSPPTNPQLLKNEPFDIEDIPYNAFKDTDDDSSSDFDSYHEVREFEASYKLVKNENEHEDSLNPENIEAFEYVEWDEDSESDEESVSEMDVTILQDSVRKKSEELKRNRNTLQSMLEMISKQEETITKLEAELETLSKGNDCKEEIERNGDQAGESESGETVAKQPKIVASNEKDLQTFSISLYYFSPGVYAYVRSLIPQLPSKQEIVNLNQSGKASDIFPPGVLDVDKIILD